MQSLDVKQSVRFRRANLQLKIKRRMHWGCAVVNNFETISCSKNQEFTIIDFYNFLWFIYTLDLWFFDGCDFSCMFHLWIFYGFFMVSL